MEDFASSPKLEPVPNLFREEVRWDSSSPLEREVK